MMWTTQPLTTEQEAALRDAAPSNPAPVIVGVPPGVPNVQVAGTLVVLDRGLTLPGDRHVKWALHPGWSGIPLLFVADEAPDIPSQVYLG